MFTIEYAKNLIWCNAEHTAFDCVVKYLQFDEELPTTVSSADKYHHIKDLWANGLAGNYGPIQEYIASTPPPPKPEIQNQPTVVGSQTL